MTTICPMGPVMIDLKGVSLDEDEKGAIAHPACGGVILFTRNYDSPEQVTNLIASIRRARDGEILVAVDQEGGRVQRFNEGFTRMPAAACYAKEYQSNDESACAEAESAGWLMASELLSVGVDFSFAPVLDVNCGISEIIGDRSFSRDPAIVAELAAAFRRGMRRAGMAAVGKHFPGHGGVELDSHLTLPEDHRSFDELWRKDLGPFRRLIDNGLEAVMPAHIIYPSVDASPAGFSAIWIQEILRGKLGFKGAVFSDDLSMQGAAFAGDYPERARRAMHAGCDMVLVCNKPEAAIEVLNSVDEEVDPVCQSRLQAMRASENPNREELLRSADWLAAQEQLQRFA